MVKSDCGTGNEYGSEGNPALLLVRIETSLQSPLTNACTITFYLLGYVQCCIEVRGLKGCMKRRVQVGATYQRNGTTRKRCGKGERAAMNQEEETSQLEQCHIKRRDQTQ